MKIRYKMGKQLTMRKLFNISIILAILLTLYVNPPLLANSAVMAEKNEDAKVVIYMIDNLSLYDINPQNTPYLWDLHNKGSIGLLNTITGGERTIKNATTTISAGRLAVGSSMANLNFNANSIYNGEIVADVFHRTTGQQPQTENIVVTNIEVIKKNNEQRRLGKPGQLGEALHRLGLTTAVIGNSDRFDIIDRPGALILMDEKGIIDTGQIENISKPHCSLDDYWTDYELLYRQFNEFAKADAILVEYGDLTRLEAMHTSLVSPLYKNERRKILAKIDTSIADIENSLNKNKTSRYVISPSPSRNSYIPNALLTPLIIIKPDGKEGELLTSYSTRRDGIILLTNLKNTILHDFSPATKSPIYSVSNPNAYKYLIELNQRAVFTYTSQPLVLFILIACLVILFLLNTYLLYKQKYYSLREKILCFIISLPIALLIIPLFSIYDKYLFIIVALALCLSLSGLAIILNKISKINSLSFLFFITILLIFLDLLLGLDLIAKSIMSYQIISGARYYGIGNEYMGVLIGATISWAALYLTNSSKPYRYTVTAILFALVVFLIAYPLFGINLGGTITASIALGYTLLSFYKPKVAAKEIFSIMVGTGLVLLTIVIIDISQPAQLQSHLGKNISLITNQGWAELSSLIIRKLEMHINIINYKYLGWIFLVLLISITTFFYLPSQNINKIKSSANHIYIGLKGIIIAAIIAFIFNDSGVTAAATLSLYLLSLLIYSLSMSKKGLL